MRAKTLVLIAFAIIVSSRAYAETPSEQFAQLLKDTWAFELRENPLFATEAGDNRYNDQLPRESLEAQRERIAQRRKLFQRLEQIDRDALPREDQINYDIFGRQLQTKIKEYQFQAHFIPITNREGFHISFPELPKNVPLDSVDDYENYISRLGQFRRYTQDHIELMRAGIEHQLVLPAVVLEGYQAMLKPHIVQDVTQSLLYAPFEKFPERVGKEDRDRLAASGRQAIERSVVPGYQAFLTFMQQEYVPAARGSIAAAALPDGRAYYRHLVRKFTTLEITPEAVHEIGQIEVARIRDEMHQVMKRVQFEGDLSAFIKQLRTDPRFYPKTKEELLQKTAYVLKKMDGELPALFKRLPRTPYGIRVVPDYIAPKTTTAYYSLPAGDGSRAGFYYVNTYRLDSRPLYQVEALSFHEAVPGHHLQLALQQELTGLPEFRRFTSFTAFVEGWALYAERLGLEVGFYEDPYSDYGRLSYEMWRACRLVVDTGMHHLGWTRKRAIEFMAANTALSIHNIEAEVDRYIAWPGQALGYKMGELKIRELRQRAEQQLGDAFDIREFHDVVLRSGSIPLDVLEENVTLYLRQASQR